MLLAVVRKGKKPGKENTVTSSIFGPLSLFPGTYIAEDLWRLILTILKKKGMKISATLEGLSPNGVVVQLWPNIADKGRCEPDLFLKFYLNDELVSSVIIEIKWENGSQMIDKETGRYQLADQWQCIDDCDKQLSFHIYLGDRKGISVIEDMMYHIKMAEVDNYRFDVKHWAARISALTWYEFSKYLKEVKQDNYLKLWRDNVIEFLNKTGGIHVFSGFLGAVPTEIINDITTDKQLFWHRPEFKGFRHNANIFECYSKLNFPLFWHKRSGFRRSLCHNPKISLRTQLRLFWVESNVKL